MWGWLCLLAPAPVTVSQPPTLALGLPLQPCGHQPERGYLSLPLWGSIHPAQGIPKPGSKPLCHQGGETEAGGGQEESSEQLCPAGLCGIWVLLVFPKPRLRLWGKAEPRALLRMRSGVAEAVLTACSTPGWLSPALTTIPVT